MVHADVTSANIVGYSNAIVPTGYTLFTPQFKEMSSGKFNVDQLIPKLPNGKEVGADAATQRNKVLLYFLNDVTKGLYSQALSWVPNIGWSYDGVTKHVDTVEVSQGESIVICNTVKANKTSGKEQYVPSGSVDFVPIHLLHSGEVDLNPVTLVPAGQYALCGNVSFTDTINIDDIEPVLPNGKVVGEDAATQRNKVLVYFLTDKTNGLYGNALSWLPGVGWSYDGVTKHSDKVEFNPGEGYAVQNVVKANKTSGKEQYVPSGSVDFVPITMRLKAK